MDFDAERSARIAAMQQTARPIWEATGDMDIVQQFLKDNGCHGVEAIHVTMGLLNCDLTEAQRAFLDAPCRDAERRFHNHAMELLEQAADHNT
ncbi:hypothetical protein [Streptomyces sp. DH10]|uniref:hypothetical protein n=1 Tax=Streptomyces sp. DH10 TaxID=3040121 RepID=UPI0024419BB2|nr:hypothetical protein [Streptomyces sp. DH10]MDG9706647.1 hypothetical protein [Streptomyces sp. DH10]